LYIPTRILLRNDRFNKTKRILPFAGALLIILFYTVISPKKNHETATIQFKQKEYLLTLTGDRLLMVHDPLSALLRKTYVDTIRLIVPRNNGIIYGNEIKTDDGFNVNGTLIFEEEKLKVNLYFNNINGKKTNNPLSWNDKYKIQKVNK